MRDISEKSNRGGGYLALLLIFALALVVLWFGSFVYMQRLCPRYLYRATIQPDGSVYDEDVWCVPYNSGDQFETALYYTHCPIDKLREMIFPAIGAKLRLF